MKPSIESNHIPDARQIDLEEAIKMTNEQYYLVRLPLTDGQQTHLHREGFYPNNFTIITEKVGTLIKPCADVETVGYGRETSFADLRERGCHAVSIHKAWDGGIPLVRRTDMEAQVARVAAEKDAEIARLRDALFGIDVYAGDTLSGPTVGLIDAEWLKVGVQEIRHRARAALNEGAAG